MDGVSFGENGVDSLKGKSAGQAGLLALLVFAGLGEPAVARGA
jgi:hypothetical protein